MNLQVDLKLNFNTDGRTDERTQTILPAAQILAAVDARARIDETGGRA